MRKFILGLLTDPFFFLTIALLGFVITIEVQIAVLRQTGSYFTPMLFSTQPSEEPPPWWFYDPVREIDGI